MKKSGQGQNINLLIVQLISAVLVLSSACLDSLKLCSDWLVNI